MHISKHVDAYARKILNSSAARAYGFRTEGLFDRPYNDGGLQPTVIHTLDDYDGTDGKEIKGNERSY